MSTEELKKLYELLEGLNEFFMKQNYVGLKTLQTMSRQTHILNFAETGFKLLEEIEYYVDHTSKPSE